MSYSEKDLIMMYNTQLRNVGLFINIGFGLLAISRFYRGKENELYNKAFIIFSCVFLIMSLVLNYHLNSDMKNLLDYIDENKVSILRKWLIIPNFIFYIIMLITLFTIFTFVRQFYE